MAPRIRIKTLKNIRKVTEGFDTDPHQDPDLLVRGDPMIRIWIRTICHGPGTLFSVYIYELLQGLFALSLLFHKVGLGNHSITRILCFIKNEREFTI